jgi:hypothetical protein
MKQPDSTASITQTARPAASCHPRRAILSLAVAAVAGLPPALLGTLGPLMHGLPDASAHAAHRSGPCSRVNCRLRQEP